VVRSRTDVALATRQLEVAVRGSQPVAVPSDERFATQFAGEER